MRAAFPDAEGTVDRDGVSIHFEVYGAGEPTLVLIPPSPITHARSWKGQIPFLCRHYRVVTMDGRGNGRSDRPSHPTDHSRHANVLDVLAVMDEVGVRQGVLVAHCHAVWWALELAHTYPDRVVALIAIDPGVPYLGGRNPNWLASAETFEKVLEDPRGWQLYNRRVITHDYRRWLQFFFTQQLVEPHSTKQFEDMVGWGLETDGEVLIAGEEGQEVEAPTPEALEAMCRSLAVPTLVIHGDQDPCQQVERGRAFADLTGGELVVFEGVGHLPHGREAVRVNRTMKGFLDRMTGAAMSHRTWPRALSRRRKALFLSSPIGLGHARRDLAVANELKKLVPDMQVDWLAQHPVTTVLEREGETIHPASRWLASESAHIASEAVEHDLHCFQALRRMDEILVANFMLFQEVVEEGLYDLVIADEAWDVDHFWHENPELKRGSLVWLTDFVGFIPMPDGGEREAFLTSDYNAEMIEHIARYPRIRDKAIFVGNPDDALLETFGAGLPKIRDWTEEHFAFSGYITGFAPPTSDEAAEWKEELGYGAEERLCVVTVGGSGVGEALLRKVISAYPLAKQLTPELRMIAVAGPRIDPESLPAHPGLEVHGYVDRLYRHLSICDLAVVQGGLTTTMELTAAQRPFLYFPLRHHFEQNYHVRHRLDQYGAGVCMDYDATDREGLAHAIAGHVGRSVSYRPVEADGAERAARMIAELV